MTLDNNTVDSAVSSTNDKPSSLMRGKLCSTQSGTFQVKDNVSDTGGSESDVLLRLQLDGVNGTTDNNDENEAIDFLQDEQSEMTWGRRIALALIDQSWYNPRVAATTDNPSEDGTEANATAADAADSTDPSGQDTNHNVPKNADSSLSISLHSKNADFDEMISNKEPNLAKAWAYFEHVALYRYIVDRAELNKPKKNICIRIFRKLFCKGNKKLEKAEPGDNENHTRLYDPIFTPHKQLGDFGIGIGLYFATLRAIAIITLIAGLISIYNMNYFASVDYQSAEAQSEIDSIALQGSAICTDKSWVPCPTCNCSDIDTIPEFGFLPADRCALDSDGNLTYALRNNCDGTVWQLAAVNYSTVIWMVISTIILGLYLERQEVAFDEDEQTAQDYSVLITNPPPDAKNPEEWRSFFAEKLNAQLTVCTIAVDNDLLVKTLVERRERLRIINNMQDVGSSMKMLDLARVAAEEERSRGFFGRLLALFVSGLPEHFSRVVALQAKVEGLAQLEYPATNVFCVFETEADQRRVLKTLSVGKIKSDRNDTSALSDPKYLFRGEHVLAVAEPDEPDTIRWQDLNAGAWKKFKERCLTTLCTFLAIALAAFCITLANGASVVGAAFTIAAFNSVFPILAKVLTSFESHASEGKKQTSLYSKVALFRWVGSAIVIAIITPFTKILDFQDGIITQVYALYFADIITTNGIALADPVGHLQRHVLAPRAATQDAQNLLFSGTQYELAERFTDATKILFLTLWYCSIYPAAWLMCALSLFIKYFVDRFCLMRVWKKAPALGTTISSFSRLYFLPIAVVAMAVFSSYYWSGFPFDNVCPNDSLDERYQNVTEVRPIVGSSTYDVDNSEDYRFCNQNFMAAGSGPTFPFVPANGDEWMTEDQKISTTYFGWSAVAVMSLVLLKFVLGWWSSIQGLYTSNYEAVGDDQGIAFSDVEARSAYIPQVSSPLFSYPLLACNSETIDKDLYDWADQDRSYAWYDLTKDASKLLKGMNVEKGAGFSIVKSWDPKQTDQSDSDGVGSM